MSDRSEISAAGSDMDEIERRLHEERPRPTADELERARHMSLHASRQGTRRRFRPGAARLAMVSLVSGALLVTGSSVSLAVSGISGDGSAGTAQYRTPDGGAILPSGDEGEDGGPNVLGEVDPGGTDPAEDTSPVSDVAADPVRQVASAGDDTLPFTGLAMVPLLLMGSLLLVSGFVLRRRVRSTTSTS